MIKLKLILFALCFIGITCYSQQNPRVATLHNPTIIEVLKAFENEYQIDFSYDVEVIKSIPIKIHQDAISLDELAVLLKKQTQFELQKVANKSFIFIENKEPITICGILIDSDTSFELPEATILKEEKVIKLTDTNGKFKVQLYAKDSISISYLGYKTRTIKGTDFSTRCDTIRLKTEAYNLNEVVIKEYLTTGVQKNKDASISLSLKELKILPGLVEPDVLQSLQLLPGISSPTEDPAGLFIRGGTPDQNLVLWDGIKIYQTGHFFNQISTFNPYIVKNVKVYRGGTSVRYGDRVSGTIIIDSDDDLTDEFKIGGGLNLTHIDAYVKIPLSKKIGVLGAFRRSTTDLYDNIRFNNISQKVFQNTRADVSDSIDESSFDQELRDDDFSFFDSNFKLIWNANKNNTIKLSSLFSENILDNTLFIRENEETFSEADFYKIRNIGASLNWERKNENKITQKANFYFSSFNTDYTIDRGFFTGNEMLEAKYIQQNKVKDIGGGYTLNVPIAKKQILELGYQYVYNETKYTANEFFVTPGEEVFIPNKTIAFNNNHTLYSEYSYEGEKINTNIGIRGSYLNRQKEFFLEPRLFSSVEIFNNFRITASAELKNQQITTYSDFGSVSPSIRSLSITDNVFVLSGETTRDNAVFNIPVIKSKQFTFGALYRYNGWNFDIEGYYKKLKDVTSVSNPILEFISIAESNEDIETGKETRIGLDFLLKKRIKNYRFWLGYSLSKTLVDFPNLQEDSFPGNFDQRHVLNFSQTLKIKNFEFALGWNYTSARPFTKLTADNDAFFGVLLDPNGINASRFKDFHRLDASVVYRFNVNAKNPWGGMLGFSLRNIYNRENIIEQGFREVGEEDIIIDTFERKSLRLTPDLVIRFNF